MRKLKKCVGVFLVFAMMLSAGVAKQTIVEGQAATKMKLYTKNKAPFYIRHYIFEENSSTFFVSSLKGTYKKNKKGTYDVTVTIKGKKVPSHSIYSETDYANIVVALYKNGKRIAEKGGFKPAPLKVSVTHRFKFKNLKAGKYRYKVYTKTGG